MVSRGSHSINSVFFKPMIRKSYHRKSSTAPWGDATREARKPETSEEGKKNGGDSSSWVPHPRTGIYYPQGHEKVMEDVAAAAAKDFPARWLNSNHR